MSSTGFSLGFDDNARPSSKVLRPPGGGSSDIFGPETPATPRSMRNHHMASNIFGSTQEASVKNSGENARRGVKNGDSHNRLFGEANRTFTPAKNHMKSSIPLGGPEGNKVTNGNGTTSSTPSPINGHTNGKNGKIENNNLIGDHQNGVSKTELEANSNSPFSEDTTAHPPRNQKLIPSSHSNNNNNIPNDESQSNSGQQSAIESKSQEATDNVLITANGDDLNAISSRKVAPINELNGHDNNDTKVANENNSSATSSSTVSPVSSVSLNSGDQSSKSISVRSPRDADSSRNPVTGMGIEMPSYKIRTRAIRRDGNPVTGEGYNKSIGGTGGAEINTTVPSLNGTNHVINKNRIPPGGYSSGLW